MHACIRYGYSFKFVLASKYYVFPLLGDGSATTVHKYSKVLPLLKKYTDGPPYGNMDLIQEMDPKHKMIVIIRNPVERLVNIYFRVSENRCARTKLTLSAGMT